MFFNAQPSPRMGVKRGMPVASLEKGDREAVEEVHGRRSKAVPVPGGAKRGMPVASPGVARRAERGPWARICA
ncbi:hypothetical protein DWZ54_10050 [Mitsuokella sp. AF33-22]|nr:hypothetical protein DWZ54_10050 [Mitsuokella sp. AF33-22]